MSALTNQSPSASRKRDSNESSNDIHDPRRTAERASTVKVEAGAFDFGRLESAVRALVEEQSRLREENSFLLERLAAKEAESQRLEHELAETQGRRNDAMKRLSDLISRIDEMESRVVGAG